jgi:hypothetical protein
MQVPNPARKRRRNQLAASANGNGRKTQGPRAGLQRARRRNGNLTSE